MILHEQGEQGRPSSVAERVIRNHKVEGSIPSAGY